MRKKLQAGLISLFHVKTQDQLVDVFTQPLYGPQRQLSTSKVGLLSYPPAWGGGVILLHSIEFVSDKGIYVI